MVNPIVDWTDEDVWEFLNGNNIPHCCLYDEGFKRLGCIGCPLSGQNNMLRDFKRWPKYETLYKLAFQHMIDNHPGQIKILEKVNGGGYSTTNATGAVDGTPGVDGSEKFGGGQSVLQNQPGSDGMVSQRVELKPSGTSTSQTATNNLMGGGTTVQSLAGHRKLCLNISSKTGNAMVEIGQSTSKRGLAKDNITNCIGGRIVFEHWLEMGAI